jgi:hypothetical protein
VAEGEKLIRAVWVTERDELALSWFGIVRMSNMDTIRWVLGAVNGWDRPVQIRQAQRWVTRMEIAGKVRRAALGTPGGSVVWATSEVPGARKPNLFSQTTRHEIAVSAASARYAVAGFAWQEDERPSGLGGHRSDGVALGVGEAAALIEVELTPKRAPRYAQIFTTFRRRLERGEAEQVVYLCNPDSAEAVRAALRLPAARAVAPRVAVHVVFGANTGAWDGDELPSWLNPLLRPHPRVPNVSDRIDPVRTSGR